MVDQKISELVEKSVPASNDDFVLVDNSATPDTKRTTFNDIESNLTLTASQVSDFESSVSANSSVAANTSKTGITSQQSTDITTNNAKTGITSQQATDITTNNAKISYTDASAVASNTTHRGLTNDPHNVTATQVGLSNVSNVATDDTAYNTTSWDANSDAATKNAIRDKIETMDTAIGLNTAKDTNVSTNLSEGTNTTTTVNVNSSDGTNATLVSASTTRAGLLTKAKWDEIVVNNAKTSYTDATDVGLNTTHRGSDGKNHSDVVTNNAKVGITPTQSSNITTNNDKISYTDSAAVGSNTTHRTSNGTDHSNVVTNNSKVSNVSTNLSLGTLTSTTIAVNSSDGTNATLVEADTTNAGILGSDKWDEIVANSVHSAGDGSDHADVASNTSASHAESHTIVSHNDTTATGAELNTLTGGGDTTLHDHDGISENTATRHTQNTDTALGSGAVAADHGTAATDQVVNVCYGTSATPPTASTTTEGALYVQYTA